MGASDYIPSELSDVTPMSPVDTSKGTLLVVHSAPPNMLSFTFPNSMHEYSEPLERRANTISLPIGTGDVPPSEPLDFDSCRLDDIRPVKEDDPFSDFDGTHFERPNTPSPYSSKRNIPNSDGAGPVSDRPGSPESTTNSFSTASGFSSRSHSPPETPALMPQPANWLQRNFKERQYRGQQYRRQDWTPKSSRLHASISVGDFEAEAEESQQLEQHVTLKERRRSKRVSRQMVSEDYDRLKLYTTGPISYRQEEKWGQMGPEEVVPKRGLVSELSKFRSPLLTTTDVSRRESEWQMKRDELVEEAWKEGKRDRTLFMLESHEAGLGRMIMSLQNELKHMSDERDEMRRDLQNAEREYNKLKRKMKEMEEDVKREKAEFKKKPVDFADIPSFFFNEHHAKWRAENARAYKLAADLEELETGYSTRSMEVLSDEMRTKFEAEKAKSKRLEGDLEELEARCSTSCMEGKGYVNELERDLWTSRRQYQNMLKELDALDMTNEELSNKLSQIEAEMQGLKSQTAHERDIANNAWKEVERLQKEAVEYQAKIVELHKERQNVHESESLRENLDEAQPRTGRLEKELAMAKGKAGSWETKHELPRQQVESGKASHDMQLDALQEKLTMEHSARQAKQQRIEELEAELRALKEKKAKPQEVERQGDTPFVPAARQPTREQQSLQEIVEKLESDNMRLRVRLTEHMERFAPQLIGLNKENPTLQDKMDFLREKQQWDRAALAEAIEKMKQERDAVAKQGEKLRKRRRELLGDDKESPKGSMLGCLR